MFNQILFYVFVFAISASMASFFKLVVDRYLFDESIILKPSYCAHCKKQLIWWQNIPIFSYLCLQGKCYFCKKKINSEYFYIELIVPFVVLVLIFSAINQMLTFYEMLLFVCFIFAMILLVLFDLKHNVIPHIVSYSLIIFFIGLMSLMKADCISPLFNLGILFLTMDYFIGFTASILQREADYNLIAVPIIMWFIGFFFCKSLIFVFIPIFLYFIAIKFLPINKKINSFLWTCSFVLLLLIIGKVLFIDFDFAALRLLLAGVGLVYLVCEILFYLVGVQLLNLSVPAQEAESKLPVFGGGDVTVLALISVFLGFRVAFLSLFIASVLALAMFLLQYIYRRIKNIKLEPEKSHYVPFVPYIVLACFIIIMTC